MYILDEVDAALDLSHTQNIGRLIKTRFKGSQFIVVSLKDGMFQNANRIFRTRFSEGTSVVQGSSEISFVASRNLCLARAKADLNLSELRGECDLLLTFQSPHQRRLQVAVLSNCGMGMDN
jgi:Fe-S cluster assembly ATPase SufC